MGELCIFQATFIHLQVGSRWNRLRYKRHGAHPLLASAQLHWGECNRFNTYKVVVPHPLIAIWVPENCVLPAGTVHNLQLLPLPGILQHWVVHPSIHAIILFRNGDLATLLNLLCRRIQHLVQESLTTEGSAHTGVLDAGNVKV